MQTTLLGLAIAFIIALVAALVGPYFIDWNQFRPQFEAEARRALGLPLRIEGALDARLLPTPSLRLRSVAVGGPNQPGKLRADKLDVEFSLGSLMRGEWRATELTINGMVLDLGLDTQGRIDWPAQAGTFNLASLAIDRLNLTGRVVLRDATSRGTLQLDDIAFGGDVRSLAGSIRGDGNFMLSGIRYPFRISSSQTPEGSGARVHLTVDPGARGPSLDVEGVLSLEARTPRFEGAATLAASNRSGATAAETPWRLAARIKTDAAAARLDQLEASYGLDETALKFAGSGDIRFGPTPLLHAVLSARQLDADKLLAKDSSATEPARVLPGLRSLVAAIPSPPLAAEIEVSADQIMLGGRPVQNLAAELRGDASSWSIARLEFRAPGSTRVAVAGKVAGPASSARLQGTLSVDSSDPGTLAAWLQGRSEIAGRSQKPLRVSGNLDVAPDRLALEAMRAEVDGSVVTGAIAFSKLAGDAGSRMEASLKADRLDVDAAAALARALAGPQTEWPDQAQLSLDIGRAISAGQELRPVLARLNYSPDTVVLDQLNIGEPGGVTIDGTGNFDRRNATGNLALNASTPSFARLVSFVTPFAPAAVTARLNQMMVKPGPTSLKLSLDLDNNAERAGQTAARVALNISAPELDGGVTLKTSMPGAAIRTLDVDALARSQFDLETRWSSEQGRSLLAMLQLDRMLSSGDGKAQLEGSASGAWGAPLRLKAKLSGAALDAEAQGTGEPWASEPKAAVALSIRRANLAPLFGRNVLDPLTRNVGLSSRVTLGGGKLTFDDLDASAGGSRLRGRIALDTSSEKSVDGEVGIDTLDLASALGLALGATARDASEPLGPALLQGWRGRVAFQALRGVLPGGSEVRPFGGVVKSDDQSLRLDLKGAIGGGEATADIATKQTAQGVALDAHVQVTNVEGSALHYRGLAIPAGRASMQMTLASQGRSASALAGALSGSGALRLENARIAGLDPKAFDVAIRASDEGQATDDNTLRQIVEPALWAGALSVAAAQIPFSVTEGRLRVAATVLDAEGARLVASGGYDTSADQCDLRIALISTAAGSATSRPEIQIFAAGSPDALDRTVDVAALSAWLAVRAIDRETRRLDSIERGELPLPAAAPASIPPLPSTTLPELPKLDVLPPGRDPRRAVPKPRLTTPPSGTPAGPAHPPLTAQQVAPLPPPIEIRPAPAPAAKPKPRPPLVLTPPVQSAPRAAF